MEDESEIKAKIEALRDAGYDEDVAEALAENGVTPEAALHLSKQEVLDYYLTWNGIHGYTTRILSVLENCEYTANK